MLERGSKDRTLGIESPFARIPDLEAAVAAATFNFQRLLSWLDCTRTLKIPFFLIAENPGLAVGLLCRFLGLDPAPNGLEP
jgi:hypothetical protein